MIIEISILSVLTSVSCITKYSSVHNNATSTIILKNCAKYWCNFFRTSLSYAPDSIKTLRIKPSILVKRILKSEKHINQLNGLTVEDYVEKHVDAYNTLFTSKKTSD